MSVTRYIPGSSATPSNLNEIQDDYIDSGYENWVTISTASDNPISSTVAGNRYQPAGFWGSVVGSSPKFNRLDPADHANSYNGSLRTRQLRFVITVYTDLVAIGDRIQEVALRSVATTATSGTFSLGTKLGTVALPSLTIARNVYRFEGAAFAFPAAGQYTIETQLRAQGATVPNVGSALFISLQTRAT